MITFATCDLCDLHKNDASGALRVMPPVFRDFGGVQKFAGPVVTVKCFEDNTHVKAFVESPGEGRVLVVDGGGSLRRALLGGNLGGAAEKNGWAGIVIHGAIRDVGELAVLKIGIRALASIPIPTDRQNQGLKELPVQIEGIWIHPGEWLYADADGVIVLPAPAGRERGAVNP